MPISSAQSGATQGWKNYASWLAKANDMTTSRANVNLRIQRLLGAWFAETRSNAIRAVVLIHSHDAELKRVLTPQVEAATLRISNIQKEVESLIEGAPARALLNEVTERRARYLEWSHSALEKKKAGQTEEALSLLNSNMVPAVETYIRSIKSLVEHYAGEIERDAASASATAHSMRNLLIRVCAAGVLLGILISWWVASSTSEPFRQVVPVTGIAPLWREGSHTVACRPECVARHAARKFGRVQGPAGA